MHEVSLMNRLLEVAAGAARREGAARIDAIHLRIGELSGVNIDSLRFAFEVLSKGTPAEGGRLEFEKVPLLARCAECGREFRPEGLVFRCPSCRSERIDVAAGREMEVDYILLDEEQGGARKDG